MVNADTLTILLAIMCEEELKMVITNKKRFIDYVNEKLRAYLLDNAETWCGVEMYFEAGKENTHKLVEWEAVL